MKQVIYLDVLLGINLFINYFLLLAVNRFMNIKPSRARTIFSAIIATVSSLTILLPDMGIVVSLLYKLFLSAIIIAVGYKFKSLTLYFKLIACFYAMNFAFAGITFLIWITVNPNGLLINNGIVYFNISPVFVLVATVASYLLIQIINRVVGKLQAKETYTEIIVCLEEKRIRLNAKVDTGNTLKEPFSNYPVIVVQSSSVMKNLPRSMQNILTQALEGESFDISLLDSKWGKRYRLIPYNSVGGEGLLPSFKPDKIIINGNEIKNVYIALSGKMLSQGIFTALIGTELLSV